MVDQVLSNLPPFITPVVEKGLGPALEKSLALSRPHLVDSVIEKVKAELGAGCPLASGLALPEVAAKAIEKPKPENGAGCALPSGEKGSDELPTGSALRVVTPVAAAPQTGEMVELVILDGLEKAPELNGQVGIVIGFESKSDHYTVQMEGQGTKRIKRCHMFVEKDL